MKFHGHSMEFHGKVRFFHGSLNSMDIVHGKECYYPWTLIRLSMESKEVSMES